MIVLILFLEFNTSSNTISVGTDMAANDVITFKNNINIDKYKLYKINSLNIYKLYNQYNAKEFNKKRIS
tara:strand:+ start:241 stop:447 length:207 start_codon:yes stop_codon:yes gene_type:complete